MSNIKLEPSWTREDAEKYKVKWSNYTSSITSTFRGLLEREIFYDVILYCEGLTFKVHRLVLAASSSHFENMFCNGIGMPNPVFVVLDGTKADALKILLHFMYHGEAEISRNQIKSVIKAANALKVTGLSDDLNNINDTLDIAEAGPSGYVSNVRSFSSFSTNEVSGTTTSTNNNAQVTGSGLKCPFCERLYGHKTNLRAHIKEDHFGLRVACPYCPKLFTRPNTARRHLMKEHPGKMIPKTFKKVRVPPKNPIGLGMQQPHMEYLAKDDHEEQDEALDYRQQPHPARDMN